MFSCTYLVALYALRAESELSSVHLSTKGQGSDAQPLLALAGASSTVHCTNIAEINCQKTCLRSKSSSGSVPKDLSTAVCIHSLRKRSQGISFIH